MIDVLIRSLDTEFGYSIWIYDKNEATGEIRVLNLEGTFKWEPYVQGNLLPKPIFSTSTMDGDLIFNKFIERLKEMGYGKDKLSIESGELKAMRDHLADMKKLVFTPPPHFAPIIVTGGPDIKTIPYPTPGKMTPGRVFMPGSENGYDPLPCDRTVAVKASRVRKAAKQCGNAASVLKEVFPELFGPGWQSDETD